MTEELNVLDYRRTDLYGHLLGIFTKLNILSTLNITASQLLDFLIDVDSAYHPTPYHSFYHAADIVVILYYMLNELDAKHYLTNKQIAILMLSAICHDIGHVSRSTHCFFYSLFVSSQGLTMIFKLKQRVTWPVIITTNPYSNHNLST
jgi:hypothetical protein